jgi:hypothetical protein
MSLTSFRDSLQEGLLSVLWRQWSALGLATHSTSEDRCPVDLEALLVATGALAERDRRLPNLAEQWLNVNSGMTMTARLERMHRHIRKLAGQYRTEFVWDKLDQIRHPVSTSSHGSSKRAASPSSAGPAPAQITLRNLFGINARADILVYLLSGGTNNSAGIARETWFDQKAVYRVLESWSNAGICARPGKTSPGGYRLLRTQEWLVLFGFKRPLRRVNWGSSLFTLLIILQAASSRIRVGDAYLLSSLLRDLHGELAAAALPWSLTMPDPGSSPGEEYFQPAADGVLTLISAMAGE